MYKTSDFKKISYKPGEVAAMLGVTVKTIQNYDKDGRLTVHRSPTNRRVIMRDDLLSYLDGQGMLIHDAVVVRHDVVYARVGTEAERRAGTLDAQALATMEAAEELQRQVVLKDVGSGLDDARPAYRELLKMVMNGQVRHVYVASEATLTESGFQTLRTMFEGYGTDIVVPGQP